MNETVVRELLRAAAPEPGTALQPSALLHSARRRRRGRALVLPLAASLPLAAALIALPAMTLPDVSVPSLPSLGGTAGTAPVATRSFPASAVSDGQAPAQDEPFELASARLPDGREIALVGYRSVDGQRCTGWVGASGIGLPSGCHASRTPNDEQGLVFGQFSETTAQRQPLGTVYVWGSAPRDADFVKLVDQVGRATEVKVTATTHRGGYDDRTYFVALVPDGAVPASATAHAEDGRQLARR